MFRVNREPILHPHTGPYAPLISAIEGDLDTVQHILSFRDYRGVPLIDINNMHHSAKTALIQATWGNPINEDIITYLLNIRDKNNNLVIDINKVASYGKTVFSFLLSSSCLAPLSVRARILSQILNIRDARGNILANLSSDVYSVPLLVQALDTDVHILRILLDVRDQHGYPVLSPNVMYGDETLLDIAMKGRYGRPPDPLMIQAIIDAGGVRRNQLNQRQNEEVPQRTVVNVPPRENAIVRLPQPLNTSIRQETTADLQIIEFNNQPQNTHSPFVEQTSKTSLLALQAHYKNKLADFDHILNEINHLLNHFNYNELVISKEMSFKDKKEYALNMWSLLLSRIDYIYSITDQSHKTIISLIWTALKDKNIDVLCEEERHILAPGQIETPEFILKLRRASFVECLINADREYRSQGRELNICIGGAIHTLLSCLNKGHNLVVISTTQASVKEDANQIVLSLLSSEIRKKPIQEMRAILHSWEDDDSMAEKFRNKFVSIANHKLIYIYGSLLSEQERKEITDNFIYLERPNLNDFLTQLLVSIAALKPTNIGMVDNAIAKLKSMAKNAYSPASARTLDEEYLFINNFFTIYKIIEKITDQSKIYFEDKSFLINRNLCFDKFLQRFHNSAAKPELLYQFEEDFREFHEFDITAAETLVNFLPVISSKDREKGLRLLDELYFNIHSKNNMQSVKVMLSVYIKSLPSHYIESPLSQADQKIEDPIKALQQLIQNRLNLISLSNDLIKLRRSASTSKKIIDFSNLLIHLLEEKDGYLSFEEFKKLQKDAQRILAPSTNLMYLLFGINKSEIEAQRLHQEILMKHFPPCAVRSD